MYISRMKLYKFNKKVKHPVVNGVKICTVCKTKKPIDQYSKVSPYNSRLKAACDKCLQELTRKYKQNRLEKLSVKID